MVEGKKWLLWPAMALGSPYAYTPHIINTWKCKTQHHPCGGVCLQSQNSGGWGMISTWRPDLVTQQDCLKTEQTQIPYEPRVHYHTKAPHTCQRRSCFETCNLNYFNSIAFIQIENDYRNMEKWGTSSYFCLNEAWPGAITNTIMYYQATYDPLLLLIINTNTHKDYLFSNK